MWIPTIRSVYLWRLYSGDTCFKIWNENTQLTKTHIITGWGSAEMAISRVKNKVVVVSCRYILIFIQVKKKKPQQPKSPPPKIKKQTQNLWKLSFKQIEINRWPTRNNAGSSRKVRRKILPALLQGKRKDYFSFITASNTGNL